VSAICIRENAVFTQYFSYPPNSQPHENNWLYFGQVFFEETSLEKTKRNIGVTVKDRQEKYILKDTISVTGKQINAYVTWHDFEQIKIVFYDGPSMRHDDFENKKESVKILKEITYVFNKDKGIFQRLP
jgi:hypothetical protein